MANPPNFDQKYRSNPPPICRNADNRIADLDGSKAEPEPVMKRELSPRDIAELSRKLLAAALEGKAQTAKDLLEKGAYVDARDRNGRTPLMIAARGDNVDMAENLIKANAELHAGDNYGKTALHWAAFFGHRKIAEMLLAHGMRPDVRDTFGWTALMTTAFFGDIDTAIILLSHGADANCVNRECETASAIAVNRNRTHMVELLESYLSK